MKRAYRAALGALALSWLTTIAYAEPKPIKLDTTHSRIGFTASTLLFDVEGTFKKFELLVDGDPAKPTHAKVSFQIDAASLDTQNKQRDEHLASADFFDVKKYPKISFVSDAIVQEGNTLKVSGTLDLHGHKKKLTLPLKKASGKNGAGADSTSYKGKLTVNRNDFGIGANSVAAKISLQDEVELQLLVVTLP